MVIGNENFKQAYSSLNAIQKQAVDMIDGPVMVIAGPGTGKTQVLAARIANILTKTDTKPHNVLALTFTDAAAKNMRERVVQMIGKTGYYVTITTFHSFCKDVIETHPEYFSLNREAQALTQIERFDIFETLLQDLPLDILKPINAPLFYVRECIKAISDLKKEGVTPANFDLIVEQEQADYQDEQETFTKAQKTKKEKLVAKHQELALIYHAYQSKLTEMHRYDFDDMITFVMQAFQLHEELLLEYQENIHYFLVDEYQDTNTAQNTVIDSLASYWGEQANIFVVGDPNQSIYRFQGASVENMLGFVDRYPQAAVITLETGYRSTQLIYDAAHSLIQNNLLTQNDGVLTTKNALLEKVGQKLTSVKEKGVPIELYTAPSDIAETIYVADTIESLLKTDVKPEEIVVLYRNNVDVDSIQEILSRKNIAYEISGGVNILLVDEIIQLLSLLEIIVSVRKGNKVSALFEILTYEWLGLDKVAVLELARHAGTQRLMMTDVVEKGYAAYVETCETCLLTEVMWSQLEETIHKIKEWGIAELSVNTSVWFSQVLEESGYLEWLKTKETSLELLLQINTLFNELKSQQALNEEVKLEQFLHNITLMKEHGLSIQAEDLNINQGAVKLTTAHSAKGQEWRHVFIIKCIDGKWGNSKKREILPLPEGLLKNTDLSKKEKNEDDRRLFYVALTRGKEKVYISYPKTIVQNSSSKEMLASMFIDEFSDYIADVSEVKTSNLAEKAQVHIETLLKPAKRMHSDEYEKRFYAEIVRKFSLSITALNDYLRDPQLFVYKHLLRVPEPRSEIQAYGTAMHKALEFLYRQWCFERKKLNIDEVLAEFEIALQAESIHIEEFDRRLATGKRNLTAYCQQLQQQSPDVMVIEKTFGRGMSKTFLDDIPLVGRIDRIDWLDDTHTRARVIDYKTGKQRTVTEIEGTTATAQKDFTQREKELPDSIKGAYKRQLLFYKLLAELDSTFKPIITEGEFDFVEPDKQKGSFTKRIFTLETNDVEDLKRLIKQVMQEIRELQFV